MRGLRKPYRCISEQSKTGFEAMIIGVSAVFRCCSLDSLQVALSYKA